MLCVEARADSWISPQPRVFASEDGEKSLKVIPIREGEDAAKGKASATSFRLNFDGSEQKLGEWKLVNTPMRVLIPENVDFFVTLDTYAKLGWEHTLVIYNTNGELLHDLKLEDLLTPKEIGDHVKETVSSRWWREGAILNFDTPQTLVEVGEGDQKMTFVKSHPEKTRLNIAFKWGRKISIALATGKVENAA